MSKAKNPLGRNLAALLGGESTAATEAMAGAAAMLDQNQLLTVPIESLKPSPNQARRSFNSTSLMELVASITEHGILQPILVSPRTKDGFYTIIAGERRWRAAAMAKLAKVPVTIMAKNKNTQEASLVENLQREDLNPMEEAMAFSMLLKLGSTHEQLAKRIGKSRPYISNSVRLLDLPKEIQRDVEKGEMPTATARVLVGKPDALRLAKVIKGQKLNVRQAEKLALQKQTSPKETDDLILRWQKMVSEALGMKVAIKQNPNKKGTFTIHYQTQEQLETLVETLNHPLQK